MNKMIPHKIKTIFVVEYDGKDIAICNTEQDAKDFIQYYKSDCRPSDKSVFSIREQALLEMIDKEWKEFLDDVVPKDMLSKEEFRTATDIFNQRGKLEVLRYLKSLNKFQGLKSTVLYFDAYIRGDEVNRR